MKKLAFGVRAIMIWARLIYGQRYAFFSMLCMFTVGLLFIYHLRPMDMTSGIQTDAPKRPSKQTHHNIPKKVTAPPRNGANDISSDEGKTTFPPLLLKQHEVPPQIFKHGLPERKGRSKEDGEWVRLQSAQREVYLYSAFYDNRQSLRSLPYIRIVGVIEVSHGSIPAFIRKMAAAANGSAQAAVDKPDNNTLDIYCLTYLKQRTSPVVVQAEGLEIGFGALRHGKEFKTYIISCKQNTRAIPETVSILLHPDDPPTFLMNVEIPERPPQQQNFGLCVSVSYWQFDPYRLVEWMELQHIMGVNKVTIYNNSLHEDTARIFKYYDRQGFVDFRQSHNYLKDPGEVTIHMHMSPVLNDCMYRNMYRFKYLVVIDLDEYLVPMKHFSLMEMMDELKTVIVSAPGEVATDYMFRNVYMYTDLSQDDTTQPRQLSTLRHRHAQPPSQRGYSVKSIIDPRACTNLHSHVCWGQTKDYDTAGYLVEVPVSSGVLFHYKRCHLSVDECEHAKTTASPTDIMLKYQTELKKRVPAKLKELGLEPLSL